MWDSTLEGRSATELTRGRHITGDAQKRDGRMLESQFLSLRVAYSECAQGASESFLHLDHTNDLAQWITDIKAPNARHARSGAVAGGRLRRSKIFLSLASFFIYYCYRNGASN